MNTKQIRNVDISGIQHLPMIDFIGNDFAIFDDIRDIPFTPYPTRLNAACLAVCRKGRCKMNINLQEYEMKEGLWSAKDTNRHSNPSNVSVPESDGRG